MSERERGIKEEGSKKAGLERGGKWIVVNR